MRVGLFVPRYIDAFEPEVGIATLELLERLGCTVEYPYDQTCCGQPMTNTGCHREAIGAEELFVRNFAGYDYIVAPSGSCVHQVRVNMTSVEQTDDVMAVRARTFELTEFLHDVLHVKEFPWASFPQRPLRQHIARIRGQDDDPRGGVLAFDRYDGIQPAHIGHLQIHQGHIGTKLAVELDRLLAVDRFRDQPHVGLRGNQGSDPGTQQRVIVDAKDADQRAILRHRAIVRHRGQMLRRRAGLGQTDDPKGAGRRLGNSDLVL